MRLLLCLAVACSLSAQTPYLVEDLTEGPASTSFGNRMAAGDLLYFNRFDAPAPPYGSLWRSDGTAAGTLQLHAQEYADPNYGFLSLGRSLFFHAASDNGPWTTDGTPQGTKPLEETVGSLPGALAFLAGDRMLVNSWDGELVSVPWPSGRPAVALSPGYAQRFTSLAGRAYYTADALWSTDGTPEGTYVVDAGRPGPESPMVAMGGHLYWLSGNGRKLWRSDGTYDGTSLVATLPEPVVRLVPAETQLFFAGGQGGGLWVTDGTEAGTRALAANPVSGQMTPLRDKIIFTNPGLGGSDLWVSDGTVAGTHMIRHEPAEHTFTRAGSLVYFAAAHIDSGTELWSTDGTSAGTKLAGDLEPGFPSGAPADMIAAGEHLFFNAFTSATGRELWALRLPAPRITVEDVRVPETQDALEFTVSLSSAATETVTVAFTTRDGTATAGGDYEAATGTLAFQPGESSKRVAVQLRPDDDRENHETVLFTLQNAAGGTIEKGAAAGIIEDDDRRADLGLAFDFSRLGSREVRYEASNAGPDTATTVRLERLGELRHVNVLRAGDRVDDGQSELFLTQQYASASVRAHQRDPNPSNDRIAWTSRGSMAMEALYLTPGAEAKVWIASRFPGVATIVSSNPSVLAVPASVETPAGQAASFTARGLAPGRATIRATTVGQDVHTLDVDVVVAGTQPRWPGAITSSSDNVERELQVPHELVIQPSGVAPTNGATATGRVTVKANGTRVGQLLLTPESRSGQTVRVLLPDVGTNTVVIDYEGDANFLPQTQTWTAYRTRGRVTFHASATINGEKLVVRVYLTGSPLATPGGTVVLDGRTEVPLTPIGPGIAHATAAIDIPEALSIGLVYSGDARYLERPHTVPIRAARRRSARP